MKLQNPFKLQNWKFKKFLIAILFFQISLSGLFVLNNLGIDTSILRPLIGFIYLSFVPGYLLLRILKLHKLSNIESFLYALGLSLFIDMFVGFLMNMFYPILGITNKPLLETPIVLTMAGVVLLLCVVSYVRDKDYNSPDYIDLKDILNPRVLFLSLIPFMAIFGTYLVNYYHNNILLMTMIAIIALVVLLVGWTNIFSKKLYPYILWIITVSLIFHSILISEYNFYDEHNYKTHLIGGTLLYSDGEDLPYMATSIGYWNISQNLSNFMGVYNSVISTNLLAPIFVIVCGFSLIAVYKLLYIIFLSFVPLGSYVISNKYLNHKESFLSVCLLVSCVMFYTNIPVLRKQLVGELFLILIIMVLLSKNNMTNKYLLLTIFCMALPWSHYGIAFLFMGMIVFTYTFSSIIITSTVNNNIPYKNLMKKFSFLLVLYIIFSISWYSFVANSSTFITIVNLSGKILHTIIYSLTPTDSRGVQILNKELGSILWTVFKFLYYILIFASIVGMISFINNILKKYKIQKLVLFEDMCSLGFAIYWMAILLATIIIPNFSVMSPYRLFHLFLLVSGLLCILGLKSIFYIINKMVNTTINKKIMECNHVSKYISSFLAIFLLFNTQFIFEIAHDHPKSISISQKSVKEYGNVEDIYFVYRRIIYTQDINRMDWVYNYGNISHIVDPSNPTPKVLYLNDDTGRKLKLNRNTYLMVDKFTNIFKIYVRKESWEIRKYYNLSRIQPMLLKHDRIYDNGGGQIYYI